MGKVIWTTHLRERIRERGLNPDWVDKAVRFPDEVRAGSTADSQKHVKVIEGYQITAAVKRQGGDWIITSAWWNPAYGQASTRKDNRFFLEKWVDRALRSLEKLLTKK